MPSGITKHQLLGIFDLENLKNDYVWEFPRYKSFTKWPYKRNAKCLPANMAEAGWYCTNNDPDDPTAKCAFCLKELSGWESTDDPWSEHSKHSGQCAFVKLGKPEKNCTIQDMYNLLEARMLKILELQHNENLKKIDDIKTKVMNEVKRKQP
uniref:Uncharacterized protein n=1 Tax=Graphocephala atropunctata TaxID=36148 RepID=A0A1B6LMW8_9HEMI